MSEYGMVIFEKHADRLRESAIPPEIARARGYVSVDTKRRLEQAGFAGYQRSVPGLLIPVRNVHGDLATYQYRPDNPRKNGRGKIVKYENPPGVRMTIDVHPNVRDRLGSPLEPLVVTEGIRKADAAVAQGLVAIALLGVYNWRGRNEDGGLTALADWEAIALNGRAVYIVFDSDVMTKQEVAKALNRLKRFLESRGAEVKVVYLPSGPNGEKIGLDDHFAAGGSVASLHALATSELRNTPTAHACTDLGNAGRFAEQFGDRVFYSADRGGWHYWDGKRFRKDRTGIVLEWMKDTIRSIPDEAAHEDGDRRSDLLKWAARSENANRIEAAVRLARTMVGIAVDAGDLDADAYAFNVENGTLDLRTGELRPHDPGDLITKLAQVLYDPEATSPAFDSFLERVLPDSEVREFLRRSIGVGLIGKVVVQVLWIWYGAGANGKSTLINVLLALFGNYGKQAEPDLLMSRREPHPTGVAALAGVRFVSVSETSEGGRLSEVTVKRLTGNDTITARFMHRDFFEFQPAFSFVLSANHRPEIVGTDHAIWRRIRLVPWNVIIPDDEQDPNLVDKLRAELPGILRWAVEGYASWQADTQKGLDGLATPAAVLAATGSYRSEMDGVAGFIEERCVTNPVVTATSAELHAAYEIWCASNGESPLSKRDFGARIAERGFKRQKVGIHRQRGYRGIGLAISGDAWDASDTEVGISLSEVSL